MLLVDRLGRCKLQLLLFFCTGISFLCLMGGSFTGGDNNPNSCPDGGNFFPVMFSVFLLFVGRGASNACFSATYVATPELYVPTPHIALLDVAVTLFSYVKLSNHVFLLPNLNFLPYATPDTRRMFAPQRWACAAAYPELRASYVPMHLELRALLNLLLYLAFSPFLGACCRCLFPRP